jgi:hypothetical protein
MLMLDNLRLYHTMITQMRKWLPDERITLVRNLALFLTGQYLSRKVHLPLIVRKWPTAGKVPSPVNRLRRFLDNPWVCVRDYYRPVAELPCQRLSRSTDSADPGHDQVGLLLPTGDSGHCLPQASVAFGPERPTRQEGLGCRQEADGLAPLSGNAAS